MSRFSRLGSILLAGVMGVAALSVPSAHAADIASYETVYSTDVAYAGVGGIREVGTGTLTVSGVSGPVDRVVLYWHGPTSDGQNSLQNVTLDGQPVTGTFIGESDSNCWSYNSSVAYRADVTDIVTGNGGYEFSAPISQSVDVNGAGLAVFYDDGDDSNNRDVVIFDGNDSTEVFTGDAAGWNLDLGGIDYQGGSVTLDTFVADGQSFDEGTLSINGVDMSAFNVFDGATVPNASASSVSDFDGGLWDFVSFDVPGMSPGDSAVTLTGNADGNDCLSLVMASVNLPAGAAPNQPTTTTTAPATTTTAPATTTTVPDTAPDSTTARPAQPVAATPTYTG